MTPLSQNCLEDARRQLASCVLFRGLVAGDGGALLGRARVRQSGAGEPFFLMGSPGPSRRAVWSGTVRTSIPSKEGREIARAMLQPGGLFGKMGVLEGKKQTAD